MEAGQRYTRIKSISVFQKALARGCLGALRVVGYIVAQSCEDRLVWW